MNRADLFPTTLFLVNISFMRLYCWELLVFMKGAEIKKPNIVHKKLQVLLIKKQKQNLLLGVVFGLD